MSKLLQVKLPNRFVDAMQHHCKYKKETLEKIEYWEFNWPNWETSNRILVLAVTQKLKIPFNVKS